jgi:PIN domain nuclease of toxin-antitoxin system
LALALAHLDTHLVVALWVGDARRVRTIERLAKGKDLVVSPVAWLELQFLVELGRFRYPVQQVKGELGRRIGLRAAEAPFAAAVEESLAQGWTRDPIDRLIVGHALADGATLLTMDERILEHCPAARWK